MDDHPDIIEDTARMRRILEREARTKDGSDLEREWQETLEREASLAQQGMKQEGGSE